MTDRDTGKPAGAHTETPGDDAAGEAVAQRPDPQRTHPTKPSELPAEIRDRLRAKRTSTAPHAPSTSAPNTPTAVATAFARLRGQLPDRIPDLSSIPRPHADTREKLKNLTNASRVKIGTLTARIPSRDELKKNLRVPEDAGRRLLDGARRATVNVGAGIDKLVKAMPRSDSAKKSAEPDFPKAGTTPAQTKAHVETRTAMFALGNLAVAIVTGGIIHIVTTFAIPTIGTGSAYAQLKPVLPANRMIVLPQLGPDRQVLPFLPPDMLYAMCRYDISTTPVVVKARLASIGWSLTLYTPEGDNFYAMPGQAQGPVDVSFLIVPPTDRLLSMMPGARREDLKLNQITAPRREGLIVVRAPLKSTALIEETKRNLGQAGCTPTELGAPLR